MSITLLRAQGKPLLLVLFLSAAFALAVGIAARPAEAVGQPVFINEIHYDNTGTDTGEAIEVAGPAGTDLAGWSLVLYNGSGGATYDTDALSGTIPDLGGGFGVVFLSYPSNGIQNGSPDGLALVDPSLTVVQFLSYEGAFTAVGGPAGGQTSVDIGVTENGTEAVGMSLQLTGTGTTDEDFTWSAAQAHTFGAVNTGQVFSQTAPPDLVINEVDYDQPGTDFAEFLEIKNTGTGSANLSEFTVELVNGTGGGAAVYQTILLPSGTLDPGGYYVVCGDAAIVPDCDLDVSPDSNLIQNGAPDAVGLRHNGILVDAVSYEGNSGAPYTEGSGTGLDDAGVDGGLSRCPDGADTDLNNVDLAFTGTSTPGAENECEPPPPPEMCGDAFTAVYAVQGSGPASPLAGTIVSTEGVVGGDFQNNPSPDNGDLNGFHIQDPAGDGDAATSDGIFVFAPGGLDVSAGDGVRVRGTVSEFNGMTEITASQIWICSSGNALTPTALSLPAATVDAFEANEGMLVTFPQALFISEYFNFGRFNETVLTSARHLSPTAEFEPGPDAIQAAQAFLLDKITLDDGRTSQNPDPAIHPNGAVFDLANLFRGGDTVEDVTGVIDFAFGLYRIQPTLGAAHTNANPRPAVHDAVGGSLKVSSFNVLNFFTTLNDGVNHICGPLQNQECRGANDANEFTRQRDKLIAAITAINADVFGLIEIENHPGDVPTADLVSGLNDAMGAGTYDYIATAAVGSDAIRVAIIYKPATVTPIGSFAVLDTSVDPRFLDQLNRPVLAQTFVQDATGGVLTVAVNHLKSKGSDCNAVGDPDTGDGAGNCNLTRKAAAEALVDWLATDPTGSGDADFLIMGDLNSYDKEDPIDVIKAGPDDSSGTGDDYTDMVYHFQGEGAYSYVFDGQLGYLDHALAPSGLLAQVTGVTIWHINADEPSLIDYDTTFKGPNQEAIYAPDAYRSSDHDAVIVGLELTPLVQQCNGLVATIYVGGDGIIVGGPLAGTPYNGLLSGTKGADVIVGTNQADQILAGGGNDLVCSLGGDDQLNGEKGSDWISGGDGADSILGGAGLDVLSGGAGQDLVDGEQDADALSGGDADDTVIGGQGNDSLDGGNGNDVCNGGQGRDTSASCEVKIQIP